MSFCNRFRLFYAISYEAAKQDNYTKMRPNVGRIFQTVKKLYKRPCFLYNGGNGGVCYGAVEEGRTKRAGDHRSGSAGSGRSFA